MTNAGISTDREAEEQWRLALREAPSFLPTRVSLAQLGIDRGRPELVA